MWICQDTPETPFPSFWVDAYVRTYVRTLGQSRDNQKKRGWPYSMSMGLCPTRASRGEAPPKNPLKMANYTILGGGSKILGLRQATKKFYNKCSENSRSQIVFRTDIFQKLSLGAPDSRLCLLFRIDEAKEERWMK